MKKKALKKLSQALRSGQFQQYRGSCYNTKTGEYCVLGVANSVFGGLTGKEQSELYSLSEYTVKAVGFSDEMPYFLGVALHILNDGDYNGKDWLNTSDKEIGALTFDELADLIDIALLDGPKKYFHKKGATL
jgi:hypothetical protein